MLKWWRIFRLETMLKAVSHNKEGRKSLDEKMVMVSVRMSRLFCDHMMILLHHSWSFFFLWEKNVRVKKTDTMIFIVLHGRCYLQNHALSKITDHNTQTTTNSYFTRALYIEVNTHICKNINFNMVYTLSIHGKQY